MKNLLVFIFSFILSHEFLLAQSPEISDGSILDFKEKGFTIAAPVGWRVHRDFPGATVMFSVVQKEGIKYQRTIQVLTLGGAKYIDEESAQELKTKFETDNAKPGSKTQYYQVTQTQIMQTEGGMPCILFYSDFYLAELHMMQATLLFSSRDKHYLVIYTDVAENFEGGSKQEFIESWSSITSLKVLDPLTSNRLDALIKIAVGFSVFVVLLFILLIVRRRREKNLLLGDNSFDDEPTQTGFNASEDEAIMEEEDSADDFKNYKNKKNQNLDDDDD